MHSKMRYCVPVSGKDIYFVTVTRFGFRVGYERASILPYMLVFAELQAANFVELLRMAKFFAMSHLLSKVEEIFDRWLTEKFAELMLDNLEMLTPSMEASLARHIRGM